MNPRPDPIRDYIGYLMWLGDCIEELARDKEEARISATAAAKKLGYSNGFFHGKPWRIPGFGLNGTMHSWETWCEWVERPEAERRAEWEAMDRVTRRKARGAA